jgi:hypothetical protein
LAARQIVSKRFQIVSKSEQRATSREGCERHIYFPDARLRWDPNAAWSVETSIRTGARLLSEGIDLEYLEDPTWNLEGMSQVRKAVPLPLATNMCLVSFEQLAPNLDAERRYCFRGCAFLGRVP